MDFPLDSQFSADYVDGFYAANQIWDFGPRALSQPQFPTPEEGDLANVVWLTQCSIGALEAQMPSMREEQNKFANQVEALEDKVQSGNDRMDNLLRLMVDRLQELCRRMELWKEEVEEKLATKGQIKDEIVVQ